ncbi:MAG: DUF1972 domain-containing protein [Candidatus Aminicenantes bacterium]|nr:DUF1972 domain-containing protein [Candidatus Aminicenantes bacterium]
MKKIAFIGSRGYPYVYGGYETFIKELGERLTRDGFDITVYCHKNLFTEYPESIGGIRLVYISTIERKSLSQFIHSFRSIFHAVLKDYDLIYVVNSANGPFGILTKLFRKKTVINLDGLEWKRPKWKGLGSKYFYFSSKIATKVYKNLVTDSVEMQKVYKKEFNADSDMIAYGANIRFSKTPELIKKWGLVKNEYYLIVGRLVPDNNSDIIIREFIKSDSSKKLVIVGDVPYKDSYAKKIKSIVDNRLVFTGYVKDQDILAELYHNSFVYFHGHEYGGTNPAMLKALAYGCAVCALDTVFNREMLENEKHGVLFTKEPDNLKNIIYYLESNHQILKDLRLTARKRITDHYNWELITDQYKTLFEKILKTE